MRKNSGISSSPPGSDVPREHASLVRLILMTLKRAKERENN